jgi:hypothetical protein
MLAACTFVRRGSFSAEQSGIAQIATIAESKLKGFDRWLLMDCAPGESSKPQLDFDVVEKMRMKQGQSAKFEAIAQSPLAVESANFYSSKAPRNETAEKRDYHEQVLLRRAGEMQKTWARDQTKLKQFLVKNRFRGINAKRSSFSSFTYPLHIAVSENNLNIVELLLIAGADPSLRDSNERTASEIAEMKHKNGSHDMVLAALAAKTM